jgi:phosphogluconate dehydratase
VLLQRGHKVALVTDGRMSGASGKVPSAIHVAPEAAAGGMLAKLRDGDVVRFDATAGTLDVLTEGVADRAPILLDEETNAYGLGRELFSVFRANAGSADTGAGVVV